MWIAVFGSALVFALTFSYIFFCRHRSRGTIALHRHREDVRRKRKQPVEISNTMEIVTSMTPNLKTGNGIRPKDYVEFKIGLEK